MADPYANIANQYAQEQEFGTRLYSGLDQQRAQAPNQLFDRFMSAYQMQLQQKRAEEEMRLRQQTEARNQQRADTYAQMAKDREIRDQNTARGQLITSTANMGEAAPRDPGTPGRNAELEALGVPAGMLPKVSIQPSTSQAVQAPTGGTDTFSGFPSLDANPTSIEGPSVAVEGGGARWQQRENDNVRKLKHDAWKMSVEKAKAAALRDSIDSKGKVDDARVSYITEQAKALQARIESGEFDMRDDLLRAQIANLNARTANVGSTKEADPLKTEKALISIAEKEVPKDVFGNRDPNAVDSAKERARAKLLGGKKSGGSGKPADKEKRADGAVYSVKGNGWYKEGPGGTWAKVS